LVAQCQGAEGEIFMVPSGAPIVCYVVDTRASQFTVQAFASGLAALVAHSPKIAIRDWTGEASLVPGTFANASMSVRLKASSLEVLDELRDSDRRELHRVMNQEVLETAKYPEIQFDSSEIRATRQKEDLYRLDVHGSLTLHGMSSDHTFLAQVALGIDSARAYGEFSVSQSDYGIRIASIAGGTLRLQDELKLSFYVVARKQASKALTAADSR
jgi:polyisoprenoid-binding protein YceI